MENRLFVKPYGEALVRFPNNRARILKSEGEYVPNSTYWRRRIKGGDVVKDVPPLKTEIKEEKKSSSKKKD